MSKTFTNKIFKIYEKHGNLPGFKTEYQRLLDMLKNEDKNNNQTDGKNNNQNEDKKNKTNIDAETNNNNIEKKKDSKKSQTLKIWIEAAVELTGKKIVRKDDADYDKVKALYLQKKQKLENIN